MDCGIAVVMGESCVKLHGVGVWEWDRIPKCCSEEASEQSFSDIGIGSGRCMKYQKHSEGPWNSVDGITQSESMKLHMLHNQPSDTRTTLLT